MKPKKKVPSSLRLIPALSRWLRAYDKCKHAEGDVSAFYQYEKACLNLRQSFRAIGYSESAVDSLLGALQENVNHFGQSKAP